jgi:hypothetical protein
MKWFNFKPKKEVDERQELESLRLERKVLHNTFSMLMFAVAFQMFYFKFDYTYYLGEFIILMLTMVFWLAGMVKRGFWGENTLPASMPGIKGQLYFLSFMGIMSAFMAWGLYENSMLSLEHSIIFFFAVFIIASAVVSLLFWFVGILIKKRKHKLDKEYDQE